MAKPIKRDSAELIEEGALGAVRGGIIGAIASFAAGAVVATLAVAVLGAVGGLIFSTGGAAAGVAAMFGGGGTALTAIAALAAGTTTAILGGAASMGIGAGIGGLKSLSHAERQNAAYAAKMKEQTMGREAEIIAARNEAMQMGFQAGAEQGRVVGQQEGAQMVLTKLQEHAAQENTQLASAAPEKSFTAAETQRRESAAIAAAAATGPQVG